MSRWPSRLVRFGNTKPQATSQLESLGLVVRDLQRFVVGDRNRSERLKQLPSLGDGERNVVVPGKQNIRLLSLQMIAKCLRKEIEVHPWVRVPQSAFRVARVKRLAPERITAD